MRRSSVARLALPGILVAGSLMVSAPKPLFTVHDKAYYVDSNLVNFVRPGLVIKVTGADIAADGTIRARLKMTDPKTLPLDRDGVTTPGAVTVSLIAATIPKGQTQYTAYPTRVQTSPITGVSAVQPTFDSGGTFQKLADGEYEYTFQTKAPTGYDRTATHSIGVRATRDLTEFELGVQYDNDVYNFVPDGSKVTTVRDVVRTATCNKRCHDPLAAHGGSRRKVELCILCHQPQNTDPDTGNSVNFPVMIHKLHRGADLPSVKAGKKYQIIGNQQNVSDFSTVVFPAGVQNCQVCHDPNSGAAQADAWLKPNRAACGACHDNVNFATGENHIDLPQVSDNQCSNCHIPEGELEFDASIKGAHLDARFSRDLPGIGFDIFAVDNGAPGKKPTVTFSIKDKAGNPILPSQMNSLGLVLAGPALDYAGAVREDARTAQGSGKYTWTFQNPIAPDAAGTYSVSIEGYRNITLLPGTKKERVVRDAGVNKVLYFSVDGSEPQSRRTVVSIDNCNQCHLQLEMHGRNRNRIEHCVQCHNANATDVAGRPKDKGAAETINFRVMIHRIHTGADLPIDYTIYGGSGTGSNFNWVRFPGDRRNCQKCHVGTSYMPPLPDGLLNVVNPRGLVNPMGPVTAACMGCHTGAPVASHAMAMTTSAGESCSVCHSAAADFSIDRVHAR